MPEDVLHQGIGIHLHLHLQARIYSYVKWQIITMRRWVGPTLRAHATQHGPMRLNMWSYRGIQQILESYG